MKNLRFVALFITLGSVSLAAPPDKFSLEDDIRYAVANATQLTADLNAVRHSLFQYYEFMAINTLQDFQYVRQLLKDIGGDSTEISRFMELLVGVQSEIQLIIGDQLSSIDSMQFQCIKIISSLKANLRELAKDNTDLNSMLELFMQEFQVSQIVISTLYSTVKKTVDKIVEDKVGPLVDEMYATLDKIVTDLGAKEENVNTCVSIVSATAAVLGNLLEWIISQLPSSNL